MKQSKGRVLGLSVFALMLCLADAGAQENAGTNYTQEIDTYGKYIPSRSVKSQPGSIKIAESEFEYDYELKAFGKLPVEFLVSSQYIGIDNTTAVDLPAHLTGFTAGVDTTLPVFNLEKTYVHIEFLPGFYGDRWAFGPENFRFSSKYVFIHQLNDQWTLVCGVRWDPRYDTPISPVLGFIYKPNDRLIFQIVPDRPHIDYALTDRWTVFTEGGETSDDEYVVKRENGQRSILRYDEWRLGGGLRYKINTYAVVSLSGGYVFDNILKYRDGTGKVAVNNGPYVEVRVQIKI